MSQTAQFNPLPLLSVMPGITSSLEQVGRDLDLYFSGPDSGREALQNALAELHRVCGVLQMVSLRGVTRYGEEIEKLLQELAAGSLAPSAAHRDIVQRSLTALAHYLEALIDGASNATLRLFHQYQELQQARGVEMSFEVDLFFPELSVELPQSVLGIPLETDVQPRIKLARSQYQQALLKWLRQNNPAEALQQMRTAVLTVMTCVPQDQRRSFWWIAAGVLDCLIFDGAPPGLNAKGLLSRVDLQMKALLEGSQADNYPTLCEMLYLLARSHVVSELVGSLKQTYALDDYLPDDSSLPLSQTAQVLEQMRTQLVVARESWEKCLQGDGATGGGGSAQSCQEFINHADQLRALAEGLDRNTLQFLSTQIHSGAVHCVEPERAQRIAQDMAMAMLLLEIGIDQYSHLGSNYHDQARILAQRLQGSMMRMPEDTEKFAEVIALHSEMEKRKVLGPLANEMQGNLQHVEQGLNAFFSDPAKREEVAPLGRLLHQVLAAMHLLSLVQAEQLLLALQQTVERYAAGHNPAPAEMRAVALALSAIGAYVHNLAHGQKSDVSPLQSALQVMEAAQRPSTAPSPAEPQPVPATPVAPAPVAASAAAVEEEGLGGDEDMQEVFLEEAQEVLEILRTNLESSQLHMESREPLVTIRRGFHTLKGSGRMVGLSELGEVAWAMESAMNIWLDNGKPATPELLKFIGDAARLFQAWVDKLTKRETAKFDYAALLATSQQIVSGVELQSVQPLVQTPQETPVPVTEQPAEPEFKLDLESLPDLTFDAPPPPQPEIKPEPVAQPEPAPEPELALELEPSFRLEVETLPVPTEGLQLQAEPAVAEPEPKPAPETPPSRPKDITVTGEADSMSPELFQISTQEAAQNVAALQNHLEKLLASESPAIPYDFMRAAHTLGGVHRAMGSLDGADLAHALESWLQARMHRPFTLSEMQLTMLQQAVAKKLESSIHQLKYQN